MMRFFRRNAGLVVLLLVNLAAALAVPPCMIALEQPRLGFGWHTMLFIALAAIVPTQACLIVGWAAIGQRPWLMRMMQAALIGLLMLMAVRVTSASRSPDTEDYLVMMVSSAIAIYALLRPLSVIVGWEFGDRTASQPRGRFRILDILEWTAAVALAIVTAQLLPGAVLWVALCLMCCLLVLILSSAFGRRRIALVVISVVATTIAIALNAAVIHYRVFNAALGLPSMGGLLAAATVVTAGNLLALDLLGYRLHRRPGLLATSMAPFAPPLAADPPNPAGT